MNKHILVCPFDEKLILKLIRQNLVITTNNIEKLQKINNMVNQENKLYCIKLNQDMPLSSINITENFENIPIALYINELGPFKKFLTKLPIIKKCNLRIFMPSGDINNYLSLKLLSSLNVNCGLFFTNKETDWEYVNDLMYYTIYSKSPHAKIEPFNFVVSNYDPVETIDFNTVYFENPQKFLHIDANENIALSHNDLINGDFISKGVDSINTIIENKKYKNRLANWQYFFVKRSDCAYCPSWRICLGKFHSICESNDQCKIFFSEFMDAADYYYLDKDKKKENLWQL